MSPGEPAPPAMVVAAPVQWQVGSGRLPDGRPVCQLAVSQGQLQATLTLAPEDMTKLGQQLLDTARQAGTGLIIPSPVIANGRGPG